jgi:hypothetical protein
MNAILSVNIKGTMTKTIDLISNSFVRRLITSLPNTDSWHITVRTHSICDFRQPGAKESFRDLSFLKLTSQRSDLKLLQVTAALILHLT